MFLLTTALYAQTETGGAAEGAETAAPAVEETADSGTAAESGEAAAESGAEPSGETPAEKLPPEPELTEEEKAAKKEKEDADRILDMDLRTSTLQELAVWARELGLSEGGSKAELLSRLRSHYKLTAGQAASAEQKVITIEKAAATEYFTLESVDEEYARLSGGVSISLKDGEAIHKISAWEILYNRSRNIVTASGNVKYVRTENDTTETFEGDTITINLDTWVGSFIDTISEQSLSGTATAYRFAGQVISKNEAETTVLKNARITNAAQSENFWSLDAAKLWILPGSDWALVSGLLKVGEIPVLWLPAFFFPADEAAFHPVLGNRTREGNYVQTTTYIWGRPAPDSSKENSISKILGSGADMEKVRNGVFLRNTRRRRRTADSKVLAILLDAYANLGFYTAARLELPAYKFLNAFKFDAGIGWTRTVYNRSGYYTPYSSANTSADFNEESDWNKSNFFGLEVPFRYRMKTGFGFSTKFGAASFDLPLYSDPGIDQDVLSRQEMMDWMKMLQSGQILTEEDKKTYTLGSYQWTLNINPNLSTNFFAPYISTLSINSLQSYLQFNYKTTSDTSIPSESPSRQFYYPDKYTMYSVSGSIGGTPLTLRTAGAVKEKDKEIPNPLEGIGDPISPWKKPDASQSDTQKTGTQQQQKAFYEMSPGSLTQTFTLPKGLGLNASWTYRFNPSSAGEMQFNPSKWGKAQDINWGDTASLFYNFRTDGSTSISISEANHGLFTLSGGLSGSAAWQDHTYINTEAELYDTPAEQKSVRLSDYNATYWTSSFSSGASVRPLYWSEMFKASTIQYSLGGLFAKSKFDYNKTAATAEELDPVWDVTWAEWRREDLSSHSISANVSANVLDKTQSLSFSASLPPLYQTYSSNAAMRVWISETTASMSVRENTQGQPATSVTSGNIWPGWTFSSLNLAEALNFGTGKSFRQTLVYDPELDEWTSANSALTLGSFSMSFAAARMYKYEYDQSRGWIQDTAGTQELRPRDLSASYSKTLSQQSLFNNFAKLTLNGRTSLALDLQRYTYSRFNLSLSLTLGISKFVDFTMSANSENANIYRYMQDLPIFSDLRDKIEVPGEKNMFIDLINSFRFDDEELRRSSGFKLKSFSFSATHYLGDWNATLSVSTTPSLDGRVYKFLTNVSFLIQWLPITEIKSDIYYDGKQEKFIRRE
ncbi:MAG: LPS-assembly protein LptD [Spirochaetaceae bacterium]|nr:LPS-assembly protein LptD [Spirochaetaceae bacterium]